MKNLSLSKRRYLANFESRSVMLIAALALGGTVAQAQTKETPSPHLIAQTSPAAGGAVAPKAAANSDKETAAAFIKADTNKDGKLDREEADKLPAVAQHFQQIDTNADGFISREEFDKAMK